MSISVRKPPARSPIVSFAAAVIVAALGVSAPVLADAGAGLPAGPKENLALLTGEDVSALRAVLAKTQDAAAWRAELSGVVEGSALAALAGYLALNLPVAADGADVAVVLAVLPLDGKELFVQNCLSCHGGDRYFLQQGKTEAEWLGIFDAPYHRRLLVEGVERETFANYAAETTPLVLESVPEALIDK